MTDIENTAGDQADQDDENRAVADAAPAGENTAGDQVDGDGDDQEALIDTHVAEGEDDPAPADN